MTPLTDDDLGAVLRDTFAAHETLADPDRAVTLAGAPQRRTHRVGAVVASVAAAAAVVAVTLAVQSWPVDEENPPTPATSTATTAPIDDELRVRTQDLANEAEAEQVAHDLLDRVPAASGSTRLDHSPTVGLDKAYGAPGTSDFTKTAMTWWIVPGSVDEVWGFYRNHPPTGMQFDGSSSGPLGLSVAFASEGSLSLEPPVLVVQVTPAGDSVGVRADTFVNPRPARPAASYLGRDITSVDVVALRNDSEAGSFPITDRDEITRLVARVNALPGMYRPTFLHTCAPVGIPFRFRLVFHSPDHTLVVEQQACEAMFDVTLDGQTLPPSLGYTRALNAWLNEVGDRHVWGDGSALPGN